MCYFPRKLELASNTLWLIVALDWFTFIYKFPLPSLAIAWNICNPPPAIIPSITYSYHPPPFVIGGNYDYQQYFNISLHKHVFFSIAIIILDIRMTFACPTPMEIANKFMPIISFYTPAPWKYQKTRVF